MAESATTAASSAATSRRVASPLPVLMEALTSTAIITVSSRSSTKRFTKTSPVRAVTFQSMRRTSSPGW